MRQNQSYGLQRTQYKRRKNKDVLTCTGCQYDPNIEELKQGVVCNSDDQTCEGKVPQPRGILKSDKQSEPVNYSTIG